MGRKNGWQLAEYAGHATPDGLQHLLSRSRWEADEVRDDLHAYVAEHLGANNGVLIIDDTGFVKKGTTSAGVERQYSGTAGRTENCQIGVFAAYATTRGHTLVDRELYLPKSWTEDRERCRAARVPDDRVFATKGELARTIILRALASPLPIGWVTADSPTARTPTSAASWKSTSSPTSWLSRSPSRSTARASTTSSARPCPKPGSGCPQEAARRASVSTTGPQPACRPCGNSTATNPPGNAGCWPAAASQSPTRSPTTSPAHPWEPPSPTSYASPAAAGRSRNASRARRANAAWTSTKSAATWAGTGTSHSRCSRMPSSPSWPVRNEKRGR
ncbi:IS701 family transposase [Streptomyces sp. NPDC057543]|uniref:IS701 family transposase n=1 Tax=Streptomyces sp. NPDC057543 TaxID=3346163 RepID=UPI00369049C1